MDLNEWVDEMRKDVTKKTKLEIIEKLDKLLSYYPEGIQLIEVKRRMPQFSDNSIQQMVEILRLSVPIDDATIDIKKSLVGLEEPIREGVSAFVEPYLKTRKYGTKKLIMKNPEGKFNSWEEVAMIYLLE